MGAGPSAAAAKPAVVVGSQTHRQPSRSRACRLAGGLSSPEALLQAWSRDQGLLADE